MESSQYSKEQIIKRFISKEQLLQATNKDCENFYFLNSLNRH